MRDGDQERSELYGWCLGPARAQSREIVLELNISLDPRSWHLGGGISEPAGVWLEVGPLFLLIQMMPPEGA